MLYTIASQLDKQRLTQYLTQATAQDAILLWQDGVLSVLLESNELWQQCQAQCYALDLDVQARGLNAFVPAPIQLCTLTEVIKLTEQYTPQLALF